MEKINKNILACILIWACIIIVAIPVSVYTLNFSSHKLSPNPSDWGVFGDYLGGVMNPLLSILNLYVLWKITNLVSNQDNQRALNQFRYDLYVDLKKALSGFNTSYTKGELKELLLKVKSFADYAFLFESRSQTFSEIIEHVDSKLKEIEREISSSVDSQIIKDILNSDKNLRASVKEHVKEYENHTQTLFNFVQKAIINSKKLGN